MRHRVWAALAVLVALATAGFGGVFPSADILVASQLPGGNWPDPPTPSWETGYMIPGLVQAYELSGQDPSYKASAELAGMWVLNNAPLFPGSSTVNPFSPLPPPDNITHFLWGEEAYGFRRLSEINANPTANVWHSEIANFYAEVKALWPGSTQGFIVAVRDAQWDVSVAVDMLAHYVMAADYVGADDLQVWRSELVKALAMVDNDSAYPVLSLGSALWALASTAGGLDDTQVDPLAVDGDVWWDSIEGEPAELDDLPWMLRQHWESTTGTFYWRFDHTGDIAYGYAEDTVYGTLGLMAATDFGYGSYDLEVLAGMYAVHAGLVHWGGLMREHLWILTDYDSPNYLFTAESLRIAIPEPGSLLLLGCGLTGLLVRRRRRTGGAGGRLGAARTRSRAEEGDAMGTAIKPSRRRSRRGLATLLLATLLLATGLLGSASAATAEALAFDPFNLSTDPVLTALYQDLFGLAPASDATVPRLKTSQPLVSPAPVSTSATASEPLPRDKQPTLTGSTPSSDPVSPGDTPQTFSLVPNTLLYSERPPKRTPILPPWP